MSAPIAGPDGSDHGAGMRLRLFVAGDEANSRLARANLERLCAEHLGQVEVEVIDVLADFRAAVAERILVTPALIVGAAPTRIMILGNLSDTDRVLAALGVARKTP